MFFSKVQTEYRKELPEKNPKLAEEFTNELTKDF